MSQENVEIAVRYLEASDLSEAIGALADDVTLAFHGEVRRLAGAETVSGKKAAIKWFADFFSQFDSDYRVEIEECRDWGDRVLVVMKNVTTGRASGVPVAEQTTQVITMRDGKIVRQDLFDTTDEALEAVGMSE